MFIRKTRNKASSAVHIFLNIIFGLGSVLITIFTGSPLLGLLLVILSKWRVFAVRPRYIWLNLKASLLDFIVGVSIVMLTYFSGTSFLPIDVILAGFYCVWLIVLKPLTSETGNLIQALTATFLGMSAATIGVSTLDPILITLLAFLVGYSASRHVLSQSDEKEYGMSVLIFGLIFAEIAWICNTWSIIYTFGASGIRIPQLAVILTIFMYVYNAIRKSLVRHDGVFKLGDVLAPIIFSIVTIGVIVIWFSNPIFNI